MLMFSTESIEMYVECREFIRAERARIPGRNSTYPEPSSVDDDRTEPLKNLRLPTAAELPHFIARLVHHHGARAVVAELLKVSSRFARLTSCRTRATMRGACAPTTRTSTRRGCVALT